LLAGALLAVGAAAEPKLPVTTIAYDGSVGNTETEEESLEETTGRHQLVLRVREQWSRDIVTTLEGALLRRTYVEGEGASYTAFWGGPDLRWNVTDALRWVTGLQVRRSTYDEPDSDGNPRSYTRLRAESTVALDLAKGVVLGPRVLATLELYDNPTKRRQSYTFALGLDARLGQLDVGADYRGVVRLPLGYFSLVEQRLDHSFGVDLSWDPNR
jgi:hypothetical protein